MRFPEEQYAKELHACLTPAVAAAGIDAEVQVSGAGVHWRCAVTYGDSSCTVHCFDVAGPEYFTQFERNSDRIATGRTSDMAETVEAAVHWLKGDDLAAMYDRFRFFDQEKRELIRLLDEILERYPDLPGAAPWVLERSWSDSYSLLFESRDRSCRFYHFCDWSIHAYFFWDGCLIFRYQGNDQPLFASLLNMWLSVNAMPSVLRREFPGIDIGEIADYYEQGNPIEGEFIVSWKSVAQFYDSLNFAPPSVKEFIAQMRSKGFDKTLRAGQSMYTLIVSRSRRHGLRDAQPNIAFFFDHKHGFVVYANNMGRRRQITLPQVEYTDEIDKLLRKLEAEPID